MQAFLAEHQAMVGLCILGIVFIGFVLELQPAPVTAMAGAAAFLALGYLDFEGFAQALASPAPITIGAMFVLSAALVSTGTIDAVAGWVARQAETRPRLAIGALLGGTAVASAIVNNTPVVLILIPVMVRVAQVAEIAPTRLLIPLSYMAVMGGSCTLIGTSTNLLVDAAGQKAGLEPFGIFEIAPVGLSVVAAGAVTLLLLGPRLLPSRGGAGETLETDDTAEFLTEARVPSGSRHIETAVKDLGFLRPDGVRLRAIRRESGDIRGEELETVVLEAGDRLVVAATKTEVLTLLSEEDLIIGRGPYASEDERIVAEAFVSPSTRGVQHRTEGLAGLVRAGVRVLAINRHGHIAGRDLGAVRLRSADRLLLEGPPGVIAAAAASNGLVSVTQTEARPFRRTRAPVAMAILTAVVVLAALDVMPIGALAIIGMALVLVTRCIEASDAWAAIDATVMVLILAMLVIGRGLEETGTVTLIATWIAPLIENAPPILVLLAVFALASTLTEIVTNNAVALVLTPVAVGIGIESGLEPRSLVMAVMLGASASFATPIGYQTNTLVYGAASYRFSDFVKIGVPMNIVAGVAGCLAIAYFFPLSGNQ